MIYTKQAEPQGYTRELMGSGVRGPQMDGK